MKRLGTVLTVLLLLGSLAGSLAGCGRPSLASRAGETLEAMQAMVEATEAGRIAEGEAAFTRAHDFFHEIDPLLRERDPDLAARLWDAVLVIEYEYGGERNPEVLAEEGHRVLTLLGGVKSLFVREGL